MLEGYEYFQINGMNNQLSLRNSVFNLIKISLVPTWLLLLLQRQHLRSRFDKAASSCAKSPKLDIWRSEFESWLSYLWWPWLITPFELCFLISKMNSITYNSTGLSWQLNIHENSEHTAEYRAVLKCLVLSRGLSFPLLINLCLTWTWLDFCSISTNSSQNYFGFMLMLPSLTLIWQSLSSAVGEGLVFGGRENTNTY